MDIRTLLFFAFSSILVKPGLSNYLMRGTHWPLRLQRDVDYLDIPLYFRNERLVKLQLMCIFYDGPCDVLGRWVKPRIIPALLGVCELCTKHQEKSMPEWLAVIAYKYPELFRGAFAQWLMDNGYPVPKEEIPRIQKAMGFAEPSIIDINSVSPPTTDTEVGHFPTAGRYVSRRRTPLFSAGYFYNQ